MKWIGTVAAVLLLVVWVASAWVEVNVSTGQNRRLMLLPGQIYIGWDAPWARSHGWYFWYARAHEFGPFRWWIDHWASSQEYWAIPLWPFILLTGTPTLLMWRQDRRRRLAELSNSCRKCGYSRSGLPAHRPCPECGTDA